MLNLTLNVTQNTAMGGDLSAEFKVYVYRVRDNDVVYLSTDPNFAKGLEWFYGLVAVYTIRHPYIMVGPKDELTGDLYRMVLADLQQRGLATENDWGITFWANKPEDDTLKVRNTETGEIVASIVTNHSMSVEDALQCAGYEYVNDDGYGDCGWDIGGALYPTECFEIAEARA